MKGLSAQNPETFGASKGREKGRERRAGNGPKTKGDVTGFCVGALNAWAEPSGLGLAAAGIGENTGRAVERNRAGSHRLNCGHPTKAGALVARFAQG